MMKKMDLSKFCKEVDSSFLSLEINNMNDHINDPSTVLHHQQIAQHDDHRLVMNPIPLGFYHPNFGFMDHNTALYFLQYSISQHHQHHPRCSSTDQQPVIDPPSELVEQVGGEATNPEFLHRTQPSSDVEKNENNRLFVDETDRLRDNYPTNEETKALNLDDDEQQKQPEAGNYSQHSPSSHHHHHHHILPEAPTSIGSKNNSESLPKRNRKSRPRRSLTNQQPVIDPPPELVEKVGGEATKPELLYRKQPTPPSDVEKSKNRLSVDETERLRDNYPTNQEMKALKVDGEQQKQPEAGNYCQHSPSHHHLPEASTSTAGSNKNLKPPSKRKQKSRDDHNGKKAGKRSKRTHKQRKPREDEEDEEKTPVPTQPSPELREKIGEETMGEPIFLYRKKLERSDVIKVENRLFINKMKRLKEYLTMAEMEAAGIRDDAAAADGDDTIEVHDNNEKKKNTRLDLFAIDRTGRQYHLCLTTWGSLMKTVLNKQWFKMVSENGVQEGHWVYLWGYRRPDEGGKFRLAVDFA